MTAPTSPTAPTSIDARLAVAEAIAREAGALLREGFSGAGSPSRLVGRRQHADEKSTVIDLVTEFDRKSEALIVSRLRAAFPDDAVIAEEGGPQPHGGERPRARWLVDPLDGTTNFAHGLPFYCVSMAREVDGLVELGVVHAPSLDLHFTAARGRGARLGGAPLHVSDAGDLAHAMLATGFPYDRHTSDDNNFAQFVAFERRAQAVRRYGSAALDLALVASGTFDGYWEMKLSAWDVAAGALLVEEAGGRVTGWRGEPFQADRGATVASNGRLHDAMLALLDELGVPAAATRAR